MKCKLKILFVLTLATSCVMALVVRSSVFLGSIEERNSEITRRLQEPARLAFKGRSAEDFASCLANAHRIPTAFPPQLGDVALNFGSRRIHGIRLKHAILSVLRTGDAPLTYTIKDGSLLIIPTKEPDDDCVLTVEQYTVEDLVAPRMILGPPTDAGRSDHEGGVF